jgi:hypothetical protein
MRLLCLDISKGCEDIITTGKIYKAVNPKRFCDNDHYPLYDDNHVYQNLYKWRFKELPDELNINVKIL